MSHNILFVIFKTQNKHNLFHFSASDEDENETDSLVMSVYGGSIPECGIGSDEA